MPAVMSMVKRCYLAPNWNDRSCHWSKGKVPLSHRDLPGNALLMPLSSRCPSVVPGESPGSPELLLERLKAGIHISKREDWEVAADCRRILPASRRPPRCSLLPSPCLTALLVESTFITL